MCNLPDKPLKHLRADWDMQNDDNSSLNRVPRSEGGRIFVPAIYFSLSIVEETTQRQSQSAKFSEK